MFIGRIFGTPIYVHPILALLLIFVVAAGYGREAAIIIGSLLSHEAAHLAAARGLNVPIDQVVLYPFGGAATVPGLAALDPPAVALTALAGPFNNLILFLGGVWASRWWVLDGNLLTLFLQVNSLLVVVNLMPALPLDGGRVLQAALQLQRGDRAAFDQLVLYGYGVGAVMLLAGAVTWFLGVPQPNLFVLAVSIVVAARSERADSGRAFLRPLWRRRADLAARGVLPVRALAVAETTILGDLLPRLGTRHYHLVWILDKDLRRRGMLAEGDLVAAAMAGRYRDRLVDILDEISPP